MTVDGRKAYGIAGTASAKEAVREVWQDTLHLENVSDCRPGLFRSGTAHDDDVGVATVRSLGLLPVGFRHQRGPRRLGVVDRSLGPAARHGLRRVSDVPPLLTHRGLTGRVNPIRHIGHEWV